MALFTIRFLSVAVCCCSVIVLVSSQTENRSLSRRLLSSVFFPLRHPQIGRTYWLAARNFTDSYMTALGLNVTRQQFRTTVLFDRDIGQLVGGVNLISLMPGLHWNTRHQDEILVLAAHYDSDVTNLGVRPGSGMAALLEVARSLQRLRLSRGVTLKHSVVLVACDLLTSAHTWGKAGDSGMDVFVKSYLNSLLNLHSSIRFRGAIVLDSVFNYNATHGTQRYPDGFEQTFPEASESVGSSGDFLAAVGREHSEDSLLQALQLNWPAGPGRLQPLVLHQQPPRSQALHEMLTQGHASLWNRVTNGVVSSLPAIMLTDTGRFRAVPDGCQISSRSCHPREILTRERMLFFNQTVNAVTRTIVQLQNHAGATVIHWTTCVVMTTSTMLITAYYTMHAF